MIAAVCAAIAAVRRFFEHEAERRAERRARGLCEECGEPLTPGTSVCLDCWLGQQW